MNPITEALMARPALEAENPRHELDGSQPERKVRLLARMVLFLENLEAPAAEAVMTTEAVTAHAQTGTSFLPQKPSREPFPNRVPHQQVVAAATRFVPLWVSRWINRGTIWFVGLRPPVGSPKPCR